MSIVDKFQCDGWESSYKAPYEEDILAFVCCHLNESILNFDASNLETTHKDDNSLCLESNGSDNNKKMGKLDFDQANRYCQN